MARVHEEVRKKLEENNLKYREATNTYDK